MDLAFLGSLVALALIDSTSFGTLLIPIWLLLHPGKVRLSRMFVFLGTVSAFYFAVGLGLTWGLLAFMPRITALLDTREVSWAQLVLGVACSSSASASTENASASRRVRAASLAGANEP